MTHRLLLGAIAALALAAVAAMVLLWSPAPALPALDESVQRETLLDATLIEVEPSADAADDGELLPPGSVPVDVNARLDDTGQEITFEVVDDTGSTYRPGQRVQVSVIETEGLETTYLISDFQRDQPLALLAVLFVLAVVGFGRLQGARALLGLVLTGIVIVVFLVPTILAGRDPVLVALAAAVAIMIVTLYLSHGASPKTTAAVIGTALALLLTGALAAAFVEVANLTGFSSEDARVANAAVGGLSLQGLLLAGIILGGLGVLDDVTISQSSTVFELSRASPRATFASLFKGALNVGRDHIAATVNTLFLAYAGASLPLLILFATGDNTPLSVLTSEVVAVEVVRTLVGSLGLIAAVPLTTALAAALALNERQAAAERPRHTAGGGESRTTRLRAPGGPSRLEEPQAAPDAWLPLAEPDPQPRRSQLRPVPPEPDSPGRRDPNPQPAPVRSARAPARARLGGTGDATVPPPARIRRYGSDSEELPRLRRPEIEAELAARRSRRPDPVDPTPRPRPVPEQPPDPPASRPRQAGTESARRAEREVARSEASARQEAGPRQPPPPSALGSPPARDRKGAADVPGVSSRPSARPQTRSSEAVPPVRPSWDDGPAAAPDRDGTGTIPRPQDEKGVSRRSSPPQRAAEDRPEPDPPPRRQRRAEPTSPSDTARELPRSRPELVSRQDREPAREAPRRQRSGEPVGPPPSAAAAPEPSAGTPDAGRPSRRERRTEVGSRRARRGVDEHAGPVKAEKPQKPRRGRRNRPAPKTAADAEQEQLEAWFQQLRNPYGRREPPPDDPPSSWPQ